MATKRTRAQFEADLQVQQSPYVVFGTPLPAIDPDVRDDGSYVPVWKQEVTDDRGRKRLHGAFTGGFSAGYFNTVGSKEGWTPSTFVSSRSNRNKDAQAQQKAEDFMDEEDLREAEEKKKISTDASYAGLGSTEGEMAKHRTIMDVLRNTGETIGTKLLRRMGWRDGQGIGPKIRRKARLDEREDADEAQDGGTHLFAPDNSPMISFRRKNDHKGLGFEGESKLGSGTALLKDTAADDEDESFSRAATPKAKPGRKSGGFGVGILNDNGSDEEDPYEIGPRISYNRSLGSDKKKKKKSMENGRQSLSNANPLLKNKPVFVSKRASLGKASSGRCHDGRPPLEGFVLSSTPTFRQESKYPPPTIPADWTSSKPSSTPTTSAPPPSTSTLAQTSTLNPSSRATLLGETPLPGKSIFTYLTPTARDRIATLTSNPTLPSAGSEVPPLPSPSTPNTPQSTSSLIPPLSPPLAHAALGRGVAGFVPYADDAAKLARYRAFLSYRANIVVEEPKQPGGMGREEWVAEMREFAHAAAVFRPMGGVLGGSSTSGSASGSAAGTGTGKAEGVEEGQGEKLVTTAAERARKSDPAEEAARLGMFGPMTRSERMFYPSRLLCKRFDVPAPAWTAEDAGRDAGGKGADGRAGTGAGAAMQDFMGRFAPGGVQPGTGEGAGKTRELLGREDMDALRREAGIEEREVVVEKPRVDPERNEALEKERPGEAVFKAIFGSDSEDD